MGGGRVKYGFRGAAVLVLARIFAALRIISKSDYEHLKFHVWLMHRLYRPTGGHA